MPLKNNTVCIVDTLKGYTWINPEPPAISDFFHHVDHKSPLPNIPVTCREEDRRYFMIVTCPCCKSSFAMEVETPFEIEWLTYVLGETAKRVCYVNERTLTHV
jgi:hypothetical protein